VFASNQGERSQQWHHGLKRQRRLRRGINFGQSRSKLTNTVGMMLLFVIVLLSRPASAVLIPFENCLSDAWKNDKPLRLQVVPEFVNAIFDTENPSHNLNVTAWFNVNGTWNTNQRLPPPSDTDYWLGNETDRGGKIENVTFEDSAQPKITTFTVKTNVLTYQTLRQDSVFCNDVQAGECPLGPRFGVNE
jgi:hypothetical protein